MYKKYEARGTEGLVKMLNIEEANAKSRNENMTIVDVNVTEKAVPLYTVIVHFTKQTRIVAKGATKITT